MVHAGKVENPKKRAMRTNEVDRQDWTKLCQQMNEEGRGALVSIQHVGIDGSTKTVADGVPLQRVALDSKSDPCNDLLVIEAGTEKPLRHVIIEPIHVRLKNGGNDRYNRLEIQAENGLTLVSLNPGMKPLEAG